MKTYQHFKKALYCTILMTLMSVFTVNVKAACTIGSNLILNGDAETDSAFSGTGFVDHDLTNWNPETNTFTVVRYTTGGGFPTNSSPGPASRGNFFFAGGSSGGVTSSGTQIINVTDCATNIDNGVQTYDLSGFFGGFGSQPDRSVLTITFKNSANASIGSATIGNVTASDRGQLTALLARNTTGLLPSGTRTIEVVLSMPPSSGYNDGYADNLSMILDIAGTWDGGGATNNWSEAANWTADILPANNLPVTFNGTSNKDVVFDIPLTRTADTTINAAYTGTISAGSTNLTFAAFTQSGGTFNGGSGTLDFNGDFTLSGGTFTQSSNLNLFSSFNFTIDSTAVFNHNNGTFVIDGAFNFVGTATSLELFNIRVEAIHNLGSKTMIANETLELIGGNVVNGNFETRNNLIIAANYSGTSNVVISGNNTRTITLPMTAAMPRFTVNAPNVTVQPSSSSGTLTFARISFILQSGTFNANGANLFFNVPLTVSGGTFNGGSGSMTFSSGGTLTLTGGIFNATSGTLTYNPFGSNIDSGATFNPNGGTFVVNSPTNFNGNATSMNFHNLTTLANFGMGSRIFNVAGTLNLASSSGGNGTIQAAGDVVIGSGFTGGGGGAIQFVGSGNQTYTNNGGANPTGIWTLNKTGGTVNLASNLDLSNAATNFVLTNGTITTGANTVIAGTRNITRTSGFINGNLRRTFAAAGSRTFDVGTINGYAPVTINATAGTFGASTTFTVGGNNGTLGGSSPSQSLTRNWSLNPSAGGITSADIRFDYQQTDVPVGANEANFSFLRSDGTIVTPFTPTSIDTTANFATLNGVSSFSPWSLGNLIPLASSAIIRGRVATDSGRGISKARLTLTDSNGNTRSSLTNPFGYYRFDEVESGGNYIVSVSHKRYQFPNPSQVVFVSENLTNIDFTAINQASSNSKPAISGFVKDTNRLGIANISIELSGGSFKKKVIAKTDEQGFYSFDDLTFGETYFLNIISEKHSFSNPSRVVTLSEDLMDADFVSDSY